MVTSLRVYLWKYPLKKDEHFALSSAVVEFVPIGSRYKEDKSGYTTPQGYFVSKHLREALMYVKGLYTTSQEIQDRQGSTWQMSQQAQEEARRHSEALEKFASGPRLRPQTEQ